LAITASAAATTAAGRVAVGHQRRDEHELDEAVDVGQLPGPDVALQQLLYPGVGDVGLLPARTPATF
jgi:phosphoribulokinase